MAGVLLLGRDLAMNSSPLPILLDADLPSFLMEPKNDLLLVPVFDDMMVEVRWLGDVEDVYRSATAICYVSVKENK